MKGQSNTQYYGEIGGGCCDPPSNNPTHYTTLLRTLLYMEVLFY